MFQMGKMYLLRSPAETVPCCDLSFPWHLEFHLTGRGGGPGTSDLSKAIST